jgi:HK97 family phage major capsid protein
MPVRTDELIEVIQAKAEEARQIAEKAETDGWTSEAKEQVHALLEQVRDAKAKLDEHREGDTYSKQLAELSADLGFQKGPAPKVDGGDYKTPQRGQSVGDLFVNSPEYAGFRKQWPDGRIPDRARVQMQPVGVKDLISITGTAGAQGLVPPDYQGLVDLLGRPTPRIRDLVSVRTTSSDLIEYVRQNSILQAAAFVPEAQDVDDDDALKPMGAFDFSVETTPVLTLAVWVPITKRAAMDAPMLRGLIDQEIRSDLRDAEERALLTGDGTAGDLIGLDNVPGTQTLAFSNDIWETSLRAANMVRYVGFATPTAFLISVQDSETIALARTADGHFYGNGPFSQGPQSLWGLPWIVSEYLTPGEAWVGDWRRAVIWDRQQSTISVSDSHADFFIRNLIAVLGEQREAFGVIRPPAFCKFATS